MALYTFAAAGLKPSVYAEIETGTLGGTVAAGDFVYRDPVSGLWLLSEGDSATAAAQTVDGWAMTGGVNGQKAVIVKRDKEMTTGATTTQVMAAGDVLVLSGTAGKAQPAPASAGSTAVVLGVALTATTINFNPVKGGAVA